MSSKSKFELYYADDEGFEKFPPQSQKSIVYVLSKRADFAKKLKNTQIRGACFDWDGTVTTINDRYSTVWREIKKILSKDGQIMMEEVERNFYEGKFNDDPTGKPAGKIWAEHSSGIFIQDKLTRKRIQQAAFKVPLRAGITSLFGMLRTHGVKTSFISYGPEEPIRLRPELQEFEYDVHGCKFIYDDNDVMVDREANVYPENKREEMLDFLKEHKIAPNEAVSVSDSATDDTGLFSIKKDNGISIFMYHTGYSVRGDILHLTEFEHLRESVDMIICGDDLYCLTAILESIIKNNSMPNTQ